MSGLKISVVNVVATAALDRPVDLESLQESFPHEVVHDPKIYSGRTAYFKSDRMQGKVSIFSSGKMISVGTKSEEKAKQELALVASYLEDAGIAKLKSPAKIQNMVATADLGLEPKLDSIKPIGGVQVIYEPEQFPGAVIRFTLAEETKATILLFSSGKIVCVGLRDQKDINIAIHCLLEMIS
jgi:transcription initiation factor TFIID TATA-box-binding protein